MFDNKVVLRTRRREDDKYFILLQDILKSFFKTYQDITDKFGCDDTFSIISKLLFKQFSSKMYDTIIECDDFEKGVTLNIIDNEILIEIVTLYSEIKHPSFNQFNENDYSNIIDKILN